jgi:pteridine reductase
MNPTNASPATDKSPVALVTGAGRRVGHGIARALAARGYRVALHANASIAEAERTARELSAAGNDSIALAADLADEASARDMVARARDHFGRIDALVNSAAVWIGKPLEQVTADDVRRHFEINTLATFVCCHEAGLIMVGQAEGGAIVNVGDWATGRPYRDYAAYFTAKGSIPALTRAFAVELAARNPRVRVNAVLPGPVLLPADTTREQRARIISSTLAQREGRVEELAAAIVLLLENEFITGVCLAVDGGRSIFAPPQD